MSDPWGSTPIPQCAARDWVDFFVVRVWERGVWADAYQFNQADDAFDKSDELEANGHRVSVVRRWLLR